MKKIAFCFDLDSTVTKEEIMPELSKHIDLEKEMSALTELTMEGLFPFEMSFRLRTKLVSLINLDKCQKIVSEISLDEDIKNFINENSSDCYIITGNLDALIDNLIKTRLKCSYFSSKALCKGNKIEDVKEFVNKPLEILELKKKYDLVVAVGDGSNDIKMLQEADISVAYGGVRMPPKSLCDVATKTILSGKELNSYLYSIKYGDIDK